MFEIELDDRALKSYYTDIDNGFKILHIDPSLAHFTKRSKIRLRDEIVFLINHCEEYAKSKQKEILYEVGTDGHGMDVSNLGEINDLITFLKTKDFFHKIKFIVANTGTFVREQCNVGVVDLNTIKKLIQLCNDNNIMLKQHNCDYLTSKELITHRSAGVHSLNIAPMYGVFETRNLLLLLQENSLFKEYEEFVNLAYTSNKWTKWMINGTHPDKNYIAEICGHYIFNTEEVKTIKDTLQNKINRNVDHILTKNIETIIKNQLACLGWF